MVSVFDRVRPTWWDAAVRAPIGARLPPQTHAVLYSSVRCNYAYSEICHDLSDKDLQSRPTRYFAYCGTVCFNVDVPMVPQLLVYYTPYAVATRTDFLRGLRSPSFTRFKNLVLGNRTEYACSFFPIFSDEVFAW